MFPKASRRGRRDLTANGNPIPDTQRAQDVAAESARSEVDKILESSTFRTTENLRRFLRYVVERSLEGRAGDLKEYSVGVEVFQRGTSFDPRIDSIVRVEARRLRAKLDEYYGDEGRTDSIRIELPKGSYAPVFRRHAPAAVPAPVRTMRAWRWIAATLVVGLAAGALFWRINSARPAPVYYEQLTNFADSATSPALSPDGRMLTFIRGESPFAGAGQIYIKILPGGEPVQLTHDDTRKMGPVFHPDGTRIAYTVAGENWDWDTWTVPVLGGQPSRLLTNGSGMTWIEGGADRPRVLFSELTGKGVHMALVTSTETRSEARTVYDPPSARRMAHRSYLSPDRRWVLLAEMDGPWLPCRLTPFDGSSLGKAVGPTQSQCTDAVWSPDGKWMYFSANAGGGFHIWRQRFPDGVPEQITSGATEEQGIGFAPDGHSVVTSVGATQSTVWVHDASGERQISSEGYGYLPSLSADGKTVYYLERSTVNLQAVVSGKLHAVDLESGQRARILPDFPMQYYSVSPDGKRVVFVGDDPAGRFPTWIATLDGRSVPRQLTSMETVRAIFGAKGEIIFVGRDRGLPFLYRIKEDGSGLQKLTSSPVRFPYAVSPDGKWVSAWAGGAKEETLNSVVVYPVEGGTPFIICRTCATASGPNGRGHMPPMVSWSPDQKFVYFVGRQPGTYAVPLGAGEILPPLPASGMIRFPEDAASLPGSRVVSSQLVFVGPSPSVYAFTRVATQRNIYRIPVP